MIACMKRWKAEVRPNIIGGEEGCSRTGSSVVVGVVVMLGVELVGVAGIGGDGSMAEF